MEKINVLLITYRFGGDITGGAERYLWGLSRHLSRRGHVVRVITTCSKNFFQSPLGYLIWDRSYPEGEREEDGLLVSRFPVENLSPRRALRYRNSIYRFESHAKKDPTFLERFSNLLQGKREHCFLSGWRYPETWVDGPAMWMEGSGTLVVGGEDITALEAVWESNQESFLLLEVGETREEFFLTRGKSLVEIELPHLTSFAVTFRCRSKRGKARRGEKSGSLSAIRSLKVMDGDVWRDLDLTRSWQNFLDFGPEEVICDLLWGIGMHAKDSLAARHAHLYGPNSRDMEDAVIQGARSADILMAAMLPMATMEMAGRAARKWRKPLLSIPLFHPRDPNHYRKTAWEVIQGSAGVEVFHQGAVSLLAKRGIQAFGVGPGFDLCSTDIESADGLTFRQKLGLVDEPVLLWVGRKNEGKGYREAMRAVSILRARGIDAVLVMVGPDEDGKAVSQEGVLYIGQVDRATLKSAFAASSLLIHPSIHESFCMVFGEAWLMGKPVLGSAYCLAARSQIRQGENGFLCTDPEDYARRAEWLIAHPEEARKMGLKGKEDVLSTRGWDRVVKVMENKMLEILGQAPPKGHVGTSWND